MPYQSSDKIFNKRLANAGISQTEFEQILSKQHNKCASCGIVINPNDSIIDGYPKIICYDCSVFNRLDGNDIESFTAITRLIRGFKRN